MGCCRVTPVMLYLIIAVVSGALLIGALWGIYGPLSKQAEGFMVALAGGALIIAVVIEMIEPAIEKTTLIQASVYIMLGAGAFSFLDYLIDEKWGAHSGGGLLAAITMDGVPENLALGVGLIGASITDVSALAAAIFLSNLPEAMGGASEMKKRTQHQENAGALGWVCAFTFGGGHYRKSVLYRCGAKCSGAYQLLCCGGCCGIAGAGGFSDGF